VTQPGQQRRERPSRAKDPNQRLRAFEESQVKRDTGGKFSTSGQGSTKDGGLGVGAQGPAVTRLQEALRRAGYNLPATGYFGPETARALKDYQTGLGLKPTGTLNVQTLNVLAKYFNQDLSKAKDEGGVKKKSGGGGGGGSSKGSGTSAANKAKRLKASKAKAKLSIERAQDALEIQKASLVKQQAEVGQHDARIKELEKASDTASGQPGLTPKGVKELRTLRARRKMQELEVRISKARVKRASNEVKRRTKELNAITGSADLSPFVFDYTMGYDYGPPVGHNFPQALLADLILDEMEPVEELPTAVIVCRTSADDPVNALVVDDDPHVTLAYLSADMSTDELDHVLKCLGDLAKQCTPIETEVNGRGRLGDHDAAVLLLEDVALSCVRDAVVADPVVAYQMSTVEQHPEWIPHITLGYGNDFLIEVTDPSHLPSTVSFDTISLWVGESKFDFAFTGAHDDPNTVSMKVTHGPGWEDEKTYITVDDEYGNNVMYASLADDGTGWEKLGLFNSIEVTPLLEPIVAAPAFEPWEHPRGADGRFINKFGIIKFLKNGKWKYGQVKDILKGSDDKAELKVQPSDLSGTPTPGEKELTLRPNQVYRAPKKIAHLTKDDAGSTKIGGQGGSNEGGMYSIPDPAGGPAKKFYVKKPKSQDHGKVEELANDLYSAAGVPVPNVDYDGKNIYSEIVEGEELSQTINEKLKDKEWLTQIRKNFVVDAWLSNWDVFGLGWDNVFVDKEGTSWRIDNGGALTYRAQGEPKGGAFGNKVMELETMRSGKKAAIFGENVMPKEDELDGAVRVLAISPEEIDDLVSERGLPQSLADTLKSRRRYIADHYGLPLPEASKPINVPDVAENNGLSRKWFPMNLGQALDMASPGDYVRIGSGTIRIGVDLTDGSLMEPDELQDQRWALKDKYGSKTDVHYQSPLTNLERPHHGAALDAADLHTIKFERGDTITDPNGHTYEVMGVSPAKKKVMLRDKGNTTSVILDTYALGSGPYIVERWDPPPPEAQKPNLPEAAEAEVEEIVQLLEPVPVPEPEVEISEPPQKTGMAATVETQVKEDIKAAAEAQAKSVVSDDKGMLLGDGTEAGPGAKVVSKKDGKTYTYVKKKGYSAVVKDEDGKELMKAASTLTQPGKTPAANVVGAKTPMTGDGKVPKLGMTALAKDGHQGKIVMISPDGKFVFIENTSGVRKRKSVSTVTITEEAGATVDTTPEPEPEPVSVPEPPSPMAPAVTAVSQVDEAKTLAAWIDSGVLKVGHKVSPISSPDNSYEIIAITDTTVRMIDKNETPFTVLKTVLNDFTVDTTPTVIPESSGLPESAGATGPHGGPMVPAQGLKPGESVHNGDDVVVVTFVDAPEGSSLVYLAFSDGTVGTYDADAPLVEKTETSIFDEDGAYLPAHQIIPHLEPGDEVEAGQYLFVVVENNLPLGDDKVAVVVDAGTVSPQLLSKQDFGPNVSIRVTRKGSDYIDAELTQGQIDAANDMATKLKAGPGTTNDHKLTGNQGQDAAGWALNQALKYDDAKYPIFVSGSGTFWRRHTTSGWQMWTVNAAGTGGTWVGDGDQEGPMGLKNFHQGTGTEELTLPNGYKVSVQSGNQVAKIGNEYYIASPASSNWYHIDGDDSIDVSTTVNKYNSDGSPYQVNLYHDPFSNQVDVVDIAPAVPDQVATGDKINSFYEVSSWESVVYISDSNTYYIQSAPGASWWPIKDDGQLGGASITHHVMGLVPNDKKTLVHQAEGDPPPFPTQAASDAEAPSVQGMFNKLFNPDPNVGPTGGTFNGLTTQPDDIVIKIQTPTIPDQYLVKQPDGKYNAISADGTINTTVGHDESTVLAFLAQGGIGDAKMSVAQGTLGEYDALTPPDLSGPGPVSASPQIVDVEAVTGIEFNGKTYELQPGEQLYKTLYNVYVSDPNADPDDPLMYQLYQDYETKKLEKAEFAVYGSNFSGMQKVDLSVAPPSAFPQTAASGANDAIGAPHPSTMEITLASDFKGMDLKPGDWIYVSYGDPHKPNEYMQMVQIDGEFIDFHHYSVGHEPGAVAVDQGKHSMFLTNKMPSNYAVYAAKPPVAEPKPSLPGAPSEDVVLAWGGPLTKDGYIPTAGMHVTGKGPMHGKIISLSKNKQSAVVLTSSGEKSTRLVTALRLDTEEYGPYQAPLAPLEVPKGMALAVDTPAEALGKTLQDGKQRAIVTNSTGIRGGEMFTTRAIGPSGKKYNRVIFALSKEQRATFASNLASGDTQEQGDWVRTKKPTESIAVGERVSIRPSSSSQPELKSQWRPDNSGVNPPNYEVVDVQDDAATGGKIVTFKSLSDGSTVTTPWSAGHTYTVTAWDPTKIKVLQTGQFSLSQSAQARGWTVAQDGGLSGMQADGTLYVEPGQGVPLAKSAFPDFGTSRNVRLVASNGVVIEVIDPASEYKNDSRFGMTNIFLPEGATDGDLSAAMAELGLGGYSPMTQSSAKQQARVFLSTMVSFDQANADNTQGMSDEQMFKKAGEWMGITDLGWQDVRVGVDESIGKVSYFWSERAIAAMKAKSKMNLVVKGTKRNNADVIASTALYGNVNSMTKRLQGAVDAPTGKGLGQSAVHDSSVYAGHGAYASAKKYNYLPDHNDQAVYISGGLMIYHHPEALYGRIGDMRGSLEDVYGNPDNGSNIMRSLTVWENIKDYYISGGIAPEQASMIAAPSQKEVDSAIAKLKAKGIVSINGVPLERYIVTIAKAKTMRPSDLPPVYMPPNLRNLLDLPESYEV